MGTFKSMRQKAMNYYRAGHLDNAEQLFLQCLDLHPKDPDLLHVLGLINLQKNDNENAAALISAAVSHGGKDSALYANLAVAYQNLGRNEEAIAEAKQALELDPQSVFALNVMGNAYASLSRFEAAREYLVQAILLRPDLPETRVNLGDVYVRLGNNDAAAAEYRQALTVRPADPAVLRKLGKAVSGSGDLEGAVEIYMQAQTIDPSAEGYVMLGDALLEQGYYDAAAESFRQAVLLGKHLEHAYCGMGKALFKQERYEDAAAFYKRAIDINPFIAEAFIGLGNVRRESGQHQQAVEAYEKALSLKPEVADIYYNISNAYFDAGLLDNAEASCRRALSLDPELVGGHWNMAWALLARGDFMQGWREYSWRLRKEDAKARLHPFPSWDGLSLQGKKILILTEQGVGDEIMFALCLSEIIRDAALCVVECEKRLVPLFSRSFPGAVFVSRLREKEGPVELPPIDCQLEIGSLPAFLRKDLSSFPDRNSYLIAEQKNVEHWKNRYSRLPGRVVIGISWTGGKGLSKRLRTVPLDMWKEILDIPGVSFVNLQYGDHSAELEQLRESTGVAIYHWQDSDPLRNMDDFASQVAALDLVISADNSTVHLAGALGVPVWVMLPLSSEWRWMRDVQDTPWYPSMRLFRQKLYGVWTDVIHDVSSALALLVSSGVVPPVDKSYKYVSSAG